MPQIINNFVARVLRLVREFFQAELFEYGFVDVHPHDSGKTIFIPTNGDVLRVWFSVTGGHDPYLEHGEPMKCFVSEAMPVPDGFEFEAIVHGTCRISWFAIETS